MASLTLGADQVKYSSVPVEYAAASASRSACVYFNCLSALQKTANFAGTYSRALQAGSVAKRSGVCSITARVRISSISDVLATAESGFNHIHTVTE